MHYSASSNKTYNNKLLLQWGYFKDITKTQIKVNFDAKYSQNPLILCEYLYNLPINVNDILLYVISTYYLYSLIK